jgi:hypothetical protein
MFSFLDLIQFIIAIIFIYLILSLLASNIQEVFAAWLEFRAKNLKDSIKILLNETDDKVKHYEQKMGEINKKIADNRAASASQPINKFLEEDEFLQRKPWILQAFVWVFEGTNQPVNLSEVTPKNYTEGTIKQKVKVKKEELQNIASEQGELFSEETKAFAWVIEGTKQTVSLSDVTLINANEGTISQQVKVTKQKLLLTDKGWILPKDNNNNNPLPKDWIGYDVINSQNVIKLTEFLYNYSQIATLNQDTSTWAKFLPFIKSTSIGPSYIEKETFANAIIEVIQAKLPPDLKLNSNTDLLNSKDTALGVIDKIKNINFHSPGLDRIIEIAESAKIKKDDAKLEQLREEIQSWFDKSQERASGTYTRNAKGVALLVGLVIAVLGNVDTFRIVDNMFKNRNYQIVAEQAINFYTAVDEQCKNETDPQKKAECRNKLKNLEANLSNVDKESISSLLPMGWNVTDIGKQIVEEGGLPKKILGWLITSFAISMGAPFWFELLGQFLKVRNTGKVILSSETSPTSSTPANKNNPTNGNS